MQTVDINISGDDYKVEAKLNNKETFVELLELILGVAMQCEQSREVITQITEMDENVMNELQVIFERVVEKYLEGAPHLLDVSREKFGSQTSNNLSGINLCPSNSFGKNINKSHNEGNNRYENYSDMSKSDYDSAKDESISNSSFNVVIRGDRYLQQESNDSNRKRRSNSNKKKNMLLRISQQELNAIDLEREKLTQTIANIEAENRVLKIANEELMQQIDSEEIKISGYENEVAHLRKSLDLTNNAAIEFQSLIDKLRRTEFELSEKDNFMRN